MSGNVILPPSRLINGLAECRILGCGSFTLRILKVLVHYLPTFRDLIENSHTILIPNPFVKQLACSLWKLLGFIASVLNFMRICLGVTFCVVFFHSLSWTLDGPFPSGDNCPSI